MTMSILSQEAKQNQNNLSELPRENGVVVLTDATFDTAILQSKYVLVKFYAPWCAHCKRLQPEYASAAEALSSQDPPIVLAKLDSTQNSKKTKQYKVTGYPTMKLFVNGKPIDYTGGRKMDDIVSWVQRKTGPSSSLIGSHLAFEKAREKHEVAVFYFGKTTDHAFEEFKQASLEIDGALPFFHVTDLEMKAELGGNTITVFTQHNEGAAHHDQSKISKESILRLIETHRYPLVMTFDTDSAIERIFGQQKSAIFFFNEDPDHPFNATFYAIASAEKRMGRQLEDGKQLIFVQSSTTEGIGLRLMEYIGIGSSNYPSVWIISPVKDELFKYKYNGDLTSSGISSFIEDWRTQKLSRYFKSAPLPQNNDKPLKVIVGRSFAQEIIDNDNWVLIKFYLPMQSDQDLLDRAMEDFAWRVSGIKRLTVAKIDLSQNEVPGLNLEHLPAILVYSPGSKHNPEDYKGERTTDGFYKYFKQEMGKYFEAESEDL